MQKVGLIELLQIEESSPRWPIPLGQAHWYEQITAVGAMGSSPIFTKSLPPSHDVQ